MILTTRELLQLSVVTQRGLRIGKVAGFEFEAETQTVVRYLVRRSLFGPIFPVHRRQVISITAKEMIVEDLVVPETWHSKLAVHKTIPEERPAPLTSNK